LQSSYEQLHHRSMNSIAIQRRSFLEQLDGVVEAVKEDQMLASDVDIVDITIFLCPFGNSKPLKLERQIKEISYDRKSLWTWGKAHISFNTLTKDYGVDDIEQADSSGESWDWQPLGDGW